MDIIDWFQAIFKDVTAFLPDWALYVILGFLLLVLLIESLQKIVTSVKFILTLIKPLAYSQEQLDQLSARNNFVDHLVYELHRLQRASDWSSFYYTDLQAEVEVADMQTSINRLPIRYNFFLSYIQFLLWPDEREEATKVKSSLVDAICSDDSNRSFLVIGDPGSGKTVSLHQLFLRMADKVRRSKNLDAAIPLYLNLKGLDIAAEEISPETILDWITKQLKTAQDRAVNQFLRSNFETLYQTGRFFFIFDSFDEIPAVMDATEESEVVQKYADALEGFIHGPHGCRGLVSSRPYRAPKVFTGVKLTIRSLSDNRIKQFIRRYLNQNLELASRISNELLYIREDLWYLARNPFYLSLLIKYAEEKQELPSQQYKLFDRFIRSRLRADAERVTHFGFTPDELIRLCCILVTWSLNSAT